MYPCPKSARHDLNGDPIRIAVDSIALVCQRNWAWGSHWESDRHRMISHTFHLSVFLIGRRLLRRHSLSMDAYSAGLAFSYYEISAALRCHLARRKVHGNLSRSRNHLWRKKGNPGKA